MTRCKKEIRKSAGTDHPESQHNYPDYTTKYLTTEEAERLYRCYPDILCPDLLLRDTIRLVILN